MTDGKQNVIELLTELYRRRKNFTTFDDTQARADPGVELRFDVEDGPGRLYVQCQPFAFQAYNKSHYNDFDRKLLDAGWDELQDVERPHKVSADQLHEWADGKWVDKC